MKTADLTPLSPQSHADLMDSARARAVHLRQLAKAEFGKAIIRGATQPVRSIRELFLASASYVIVREVPATDWGYGGQTQESRRQAIARSQ